MLLQLIVLLLCWLKENTYSILFYSILFCSIIFYSIQPITVKWASATAHNDEVGISNSGKEGTSNSKQR